MSKTTIKLGGHEYTAVWGNRAKVKYSGLSNRVTAMEGLVPLACIIWAAIIPIKNSPVLNTWEDLADHIEPDMSEELGRVILEILPSTDPEKKSSTESEPSPA
jgi:hypothetical protein